jgi:hypothetical protein
VSFYVSTATFFLLHCDEWRKEIPDITTTTTEQAIQKLAKGKAPDHMGLTAEHFKKGGKTIANYTAALLNAAKKTFDYCRCLSL